MPVFDLFSKRNKSLPDVFQTEVLPEEFRTQVNWIWNDTFLIGGAHTEPVTQVWHVICRERGKSFLSGERRRPGEDLLRAFHETTDVTLVLDIIELSFRAMFLMAKDYILQPENVQRAVVELNHRFREHGIGYQFDIQAEQLIPINSTFTHEQAVRPALAVLARKEFSTANNEFMEAFDDYKKSDFDDCLLKCGKAFESVMKIICTTKKWVFDPKDTAAPLLKIIINGTGMDFFLSNPCY